MFSISDEGFDTLSGDDDEEEEVENLGGDEKEQGEGFLVRSNKKPVLHLHTKCSNKLFSLLLQTKSWYEHRKSDKQSSKTTPVAFDDTDGTVIVVDTMDIYKVPMDDVSKTTPEGTSDEYDKCDNESSTSSSSSGVDKTRVRSASTSVKYVDQSASLVSLRSTSAVSSAVARFDALSELKK